MHAIELTDVHLARSGGQPDLILNDVHVAVTAIVDASGAPVPGLPIVLSSIDGAAGSYRGLLPASLALVPGLTYTAAIEVTVGGINSFGRWQVQLKPQVRTGL